MREGREKPKKQESGGGVVTGRGGKSMNQARQRSFLMRQERRRTSVCLQPPTQYQSRLSLIRSTHLGLRSSKATPTTSVVPPDKVRRPPSCGVVIALNVLFQSGCATQEDLLVQQAAQAHVPPDRLSMRRPSSYPLPPAVPPLEQPIQTHNHDSAWQPATT